mgnify:CR=1 FL=1
MLSWFAQALVVHSIGSETSYLGDIPEVAELADSANKLARLVPDWQHSGSLSLSDWASSFSKQPKNRTAPTKANPRKLMFCGRCLQ